MRWLSAIRRRMRRTVPAVLAVAVAAALAGTVFGLGVTGQAPDVFDGSAWLWSRTDGSVNRVNSSSSTADLHQPVVDSRGHHMRVSQNDDYLLLHDVDSGRVTSVDLARMGFFGSMSLDAADDVVVALSGNLAAVVDRTRGLVRAIDPATLQARGSQLQLPAPLVGGAAFDGAGTLWVGLPGQGTVVGLSIADGAVTVRSTVPVAPPGHDLAVSALDNGALAVDCGGTDLVVVTGDRPRHIHAPVALSGALVPDRTVGSVVAVTVPSARTVVVVADAGKGGPVAQIPLPDGDGTSLAVPFAGRVYVPDNGARTVVAHAPSGNVVQKVQLPAGDDPLELDVREQHLFINAPDSPFASVVDEHGDAQVVDKRGTVPGASGSASASTSASAQPDTSASAEPNPSAPGDGGPASQPQSPGSEGGGATQPPGPPPSTRRPGAPVPVMALAGDGQVTVRWGEAAPGDAPVTRYTVTWDGGGRRVLDADARSTVVTGLTNDRAYRFRVTATNRFGEGPPALSALVTPVTGAPPGAPGRPTATAASGIVTVTWPAVTGASEYVVTPLRSGVAGADPPQRLPGTSTEFAGLTLGKPYTFTVVAVDQSGRAGPASPRSNEVVPVDKPRVTIAGTSATASAVTVTYTVDNGGSAATCRIAISPGGQSATGCGGSKTFSGLTNNTTYTVTVTATNSIGTTAVSAKRTTAKYFGAKVTCVNKPSNPDPKFCNEHGGIGVFTSPNYVDGGEDHRVRVGSKIQVACRDTGTEMYAYVYNNDKRSNIWLKMSDGYWISWVWVTVDGGDDVKAVPTCA